MLEQGTEFCATSNVSTISLRASGPKLGEHRKRLHSNGANARLLCGVCAIKALCPSCTMLAVVALPRGTLR